MPLDYRALCIVLAAEGKETTGLIARASRVNSARRAPILRVRRFRGKRSPFNQRADCGTRKK